MRLLHFLLYFVCAYASYPRASSSLQRFLQSFGTKCPLPIDIIFLIDESGSIDSTEFKTLQTFMVGLLDAFLISPQYVHVGLIGFSGSETPSSARVYVALDSATASSETALQQAINGIVEVGGGTPTDVGIDAATAEFAAHGRDQSLGAVHLTILLTDGESTDQTLTIAAANRYHAARNTMAVVTISFQSTRPDELKAEVNGDLSLWFPVENWNGLDPNSPIIQSLGNVVCNSPVQPGNTTQNVTVPINCNVTRVVAYSPSTSSPIAFRADFIGGPLGLCYSYVDKVPNPGKVCAPGVKCDVTCTFTNSTNVAEYLYVTTYPSVSNPGGADDPFMKLFVGITSLNVTNSSCGGTANISAFYCFQKFAPNVSAIYGDGSNAPTPYIQDLGTSGSQRCAGCPSGAVLLGTFDSGSQYAGVCASSCLGGAEYTRHYSTGYDMCFPCHSSCGACVDPGLTGIPSRSCKACSFSSPSAAYIPQSIDPAVSSPFWSALAPKVVPNFVALSSTSGRCVATGCPMTYASVKPATAPSGVPLSPKCVGTPTTFVQDTTSVLVTLCVPAPQGVPTPPPGQNSTLSDCRDFITDPRAGQLATQIAGGVGVVPAAIFLRSCLDVRLKKRYVWTYGAQGRNDASIYEEADAQSAVRNATVRSLDPNCWCDVYATFAIVLAVAQPGTIMTTADLADAATVLSRDASELSRRAVQALNLLSVVDTDISQGFNVSVYTPTSRRQLRWNRALQTGGYPPLRCAPFPFARVLGSCNDSVPVSQPTGQSYLSSANIISFCGGKPPPYVPPSGIQTLSLPVIAAISGGILFLLLLLAALCIVWSLRYAKRKILIDEHKQRVARQKKRAALGGDALDSSLDSELLGDDAEDGDGGRTAFKPVSLDGSGETVPRPLSFAGTEFHANPLSGGVNDWAAKRSGQTAADAAAAVSPTPMADPSVDPLTAARALATQRAKKNVVVTDEDWQAVPYSTLTFTQRMYEKTMPGSVTLGLGLTGSTIPITHDRTHAMGPKAAIVSANPVNVTMGRAGNVPSAWAAGEPSRQASSRRLSTTA